jgi:hypothetical protein
MTIGTFNYLDPASVADSDAPFVKPWAKVDCDSTAFKQFQTQRQVTNLRGIEDRFGVDVSGFAAHRAPAREKDFVDEAAIRGGYYAEVEALLREKLPGASRVVIFDHTIRRNDGTAPRQPVRRVHVDQTPGAAAARVRRHVPAEEAEGLLKKRFQIVNVWRPIGHVASELPLAVIDWRSTEPEDMVKVDLLYPKRAANDTDDDRGREARPDPDSGLSTEGYEIKGENRACCFPVSYMACDADTGLSRRNLLCRAKREAPLSLLEGHDARRGPLPQVLRFAEPGSCGWRGGSCGVHASHGLCGPGNSSGCQETPKYRGPRTRVLRGLRSAKPTVATGVGPCRSEINGAIIKNSNSLER